MSKNKNRRDEKPGRARRGRSWIPGRGLRSMLVEACPDALIALDAEGKILYWSAGAETIYGYDREEALGAKLVDLVVAPEDAAEGENLLRAALEHGDAVREAVHRKKDGSAIYIAVSAKAVRDETGEVAYIAASHKDLTQLRILSQGKMLEARYLGLLESMPDAIVMVNPAGRIVLVNGQAEELFGYSRDELLGKPVEMLLPERFRNDHVAHRARYFAEPKTRAMGAGLELFACRRDGAEFPVEICLSPLHTQEGMFAMSAIRDITERKKLQEELRRTNEELQQQNRSVQQANRLKSEFLANMSHELRTPLNGIIGFAEIMHDERVGPISPDHKEYLADILTSARHLLQLINDVLDLSKIEAGKFEFAPQPTDPSVVLGEVRDIVRALAAKKRIRLELDADPSLATVVADTRSLKQILYNYLSNAIKFTPEDGVVKARVGPDAPGYFRIEVTDTGIGIRPEDIGQLFVEFQQLDSGAAQSSAGTGLGLALTKKLVEAQGGRVGVDSAPAQGSTFYAVLPLAPKAPRGAEEMRVEPAAPGAPLILVIEDDASDRAWISGALRAAGYAVETVATGAEALVRCRERRFSAITLDIMLPDMSGRAVLEKLRERGLNQQTPVVVVTLLAHKGIVAGFQISDILSKPVSQNDLVKALERCRVAPGKARPILVVDDDETSLRLADEMLRRLGYRTVCRPNGSSALQAASKERPAAVVLDLVMPEMNGFEFLKHFRKTRRGRSTPVIVWTSKDLTDAERSALRSAASAVTKKTEQADELAHEIRNILSAPGAAPPH